MSNLILKAVKDRRVELDKQLRIAAQWKCDASRLKKSSILVALTLPYEHLKLGGVVSTRKQFGEADSALAKLSESLADRFG